MSAEWATLTRPRSGASRRPVKATPAGASGLRGRTRCCRRDCSSAVTGSRPTATPATPEKRSSSSSHRVTRRWANARRDQGHRPPWRHSSHVHPSETTDNSRPVAHERPGSFLLSAALSAAGLLIRRPEVRILPGPLPGTSREARSPSSSTGFGQRITPLSGRPPVPGEDQPLHTWRPTASRRGASQTHPRSADRLRSRSPLPRRSGTVCARSERIQAASRPSVIATTRSQ